MKDTSVYSFREEEDEKISKTIKKEEKERTIISRKAEEFNRVR
jgi:hypothetical protein